MTFSIVLELTFIFSYIKIFIFIHVECLFVRLCDIVMKEDDWELAISLFKWILENAMSQLPDITQKCFSTWHDYMDPNFQMN